MTNSLDKWKKRKGTAKNFVSNKKARKTLKRETEKNEIEKLKANIESLTDDDLLGAKFKSFSELKILSNSMKKSLTANKFSKPTIIQQRTLGHIFKGGDIIAAAKTGSGKTLAFVIPILEDLYKNSWSESQGAGALILAPTRELANQTQLVLKRLIETAPDHTLSASAITGGSDMSFEASLIARNQIIVATPGRLLQHLDQTMGFTLDEVRTLVLDEADRMLDLGFKDQIMNILEQLPSDRQTLLFSATGKSYSMSQFKSLIKNREKKRELNIISDELEETAITKELSQPERLQQIYVKVEAHHKLSFLYNFLKKKQKQKILVFLSTCKQVGFVAETLKLIQPGTLKILQLRGSSSHKKRQEEFDQFIRKQTGVLIATDVAARGLDVSKNRLGKNVNTQSKPIDWVLQLDAPDTIETYIHRAGRTARAGSKGRNMICLLPDEVEQCVKKFTKNGLQVEEKKVNASKFMRSNLKNENIFRLKFEIFKFFSFKSRKHFRVCA